MSDQDPAYCANSATRTIDLDFPEGWAKRYPDVYPVCREATDAIRRLIPTGNYAKLARHSPGLDGYNWDAYIDLSLIRMVHVARALKKVGAPDCKVLDFGSYFGNFALMARKLGCKVDALDSYARYAPALSQEREALIAAGIDIIDSSIHQDVLDRLDRHYDAILCLGVIEHIPHTPRLLLEHLARHLRPGGCLILDTPNIAYLYRREALARGESVHLPVSLQFETELPFEGHHREYTTTEVAWMLKKVGFELVNLELFNYSIFGAKQLIGDDARRFRKMDADASMREIIFAVAKKFG
ncbi:MAG: class I SAM-dependent methyltransferase [Hyphomicrobiaceae bacterium]